MKMLGALLLLAAQSPVLAQTPCAQPRKSSATFFLEPVRGRAGDSLALIRLCLVSAKRVGSYMATITFDSSRMRAVKVEARGMHATNAKDPGVVKIAGAAPTGFADGELAVMSFRARNNSLDRVTLAVSEVNSTSGSSLLNDVTVSGWPRKTEASASRPLIDSISPREGELDTDRVTDITIYGRGFAAVGNLVLFGGAGVKGLKSEAGGTIIRFSAPVIRVTEGKAAIRVKHDGMQSNAVTFKVRDDQP